MAAQPHHGQQHRGEDHLQPDEQHRQRRDHDAHAHARIEGTEAHLLPLHDGVHGQPQAQRDEQCPRHEPGLQRHPVAQGREPGRLGQDAQLHAIGHGAQRKAQHLHAHQRGASGVQHGVHVQADAADHQGPGREQGQEEHAQPRQGQARVQEEPARAEQQQEAQVAPAVAPAAQVRGPVTPVGRQRGGHLHDRQPAHGRLHDHLAGELHAFATQAEPADGQAVETPQAAVEVAHRHAEEEPADEAQHRVAQVAVQGRHGPGGDAAAEAVAHDELGPLAQGRQEGLQGAEVVAVVGVAHDHVAPARCGDACDQGCAIAARAHLDHAGPEGARERGRAVAGAVVGNEHLAAHGVRAHEGLRLGDARGQRARLVQARHQDRQLRRLVGPGLRQRDGCRWRPQDFAHDSLPRMSGPLDAPSGPLGPGCARGAVAVSRGRTRAGTSRARSCPFRRKPRR